MRRMCKIYQAHAMRSTPRLIRAVHRRWQGRREAKARLPRRHPGGLHRRTAGRCGASGCEVALVVRERTGTLWFQNRTIDTAAETKAGQFVCAADRIRLQALGSPRSQALRKYRAARCVSCMPSNPSALAKYNSPQ